MLRPLAPKARSATTAPPLFEFTGARELAVQGTIALSSTKKNLQRRNAVSLQHLLPTQKLLLKLSLRRVLATFLAFSPRGEVLSSRMLNQFISKTFRKGFRLGMRRTQHLKHGILDILISSLLKSLPDFPWFRGMAEGFDSFMIPEGIVHYENWFRQVALKLYPELRAPQATKHPHAPQTM